MSSGTRERVVYFIPTTIESGHNRARSLRTLSILPVIAHALSKFLPSAEYWGPITRSDLHRSLALEIDDVQRLVPLRVFRRKQCALPPRENTSSDYALLGRLLLGANQTWSRHNRMTATDPKR